MLGPAYSKTPKKPHDVFYFVFLCFIAWERMDEQWPIQAYLWKIMVHLSGMFLKTTVCKDKYPSKSVLHLHGHKKVAVKSVLWECQLFSIGRVKACSSMSRQMGPRLLSLDSRGYMAFKEDKDWLCYKRASHFLERKIQWFFRKMQTHCELQGTAI